jgi:hypothetical protein
MSFIAFKFQNKSTFLSFRPGTLSGARGRDGMGAGIRRSYRRSGFFFNIFVTPYFTLGNLNLTIFDS